VLSVIDVEDGQAVVGDQVQGEWESAATVAVAPDGSTVIVPDPASGTIAVVDLGVRRQVATVEAAAEPSEVAFLEQFAVVRNAGSTDVTWIDLDDPSRSDNLTVGSVPPGLLTVTPDGSELLVPVAADTRVFRIHVMMGRPMVMGSDDDPTGADVVVAVRSALHEARPGTLMQRTVFDRPGTYELALEWPGGVTAGGFVVDVAAPPEPERIAWPLASPIAADAGVPVTVEFVADRQLVAAEVLAYADTPSGPRQVRAAAHPVPGGGWRAEITLPDGGTYRAYLLSPEAGLTTGTGDPVVIAVASVSPP
jgi:hypothetical protein